MKKKNVFGMFRLLSFFACGKVEVPSGQTDSPAGSDLCLYAHSNQLVSKTVLNDEDWTVSWTSGDALTVFNAGSGETTYSGRCKFGIKDAAKGQFALSSGTPVSGKESYDWYIAYPYMEFASAPGSTKGYTINRTPVQKGYNSSTHLSGSDLLAGKAYDVPDGKAPEVQLEHMSTLLRFKVVNNSGSAAAITGMVLDATSGGSYITGSFSMNWGDADTKPALDATQMGSSKDYTCSLSVVDAETGSPIAETIEPGGFVYIYMAVAPFSIPEGESIGITVTGSNGESKQVKTFASGIEFKAGTYNTATISYEKVLFYETFGTVAVGTGSVATYDKSGLTTLYAEDKENYSYTAYGNASFQTDSYSGQTTSGAYCRFPKKDAAITILNIDLHGSHSLTFSYLNDIEYPIALKWRYYGEESWTTVATSSETGTVSIDFTIPEEKAIDLQLQLTSDVSDNVYAALDNCKLVAKD
ncbi:MAG: hypothetical protein ACI39U_00570 [Candidatus Cryptobacteroides sp.]